MNYNYMENIYESQKYNIHWKKQTHHTILYKRLKNSKINLWLEKDSPFEDPFEDGIVTDQVNEKSLRVLVIFLIDYSCTILYKLQMYNITIHNF